MLLQRQSMHGQGAGNRNRDQLVKKQGVGNIQVAAEKQRACWVGARKIFRRQADANRAQSWCNGGADAGLRHGQCETRTQSLFLLTRA